MEKLKALEEVCQPDVRYQNRVDLDLTTGAVSETTIQSLYRLIEPIQLSEQVPDDVRSHFEIAKNLALYSWFVYSFNVVAAMQAYSTLENGSKAEGREEKNSFEEEPIAGFQRPTAHRRTWPPIGLSDAIAYLRNDLAHGSPTMHGQGIDALKLCAELINELFL